MIKNVAFLPNSVHNRRCFKLRSVAQPGRALRSGRRGRWFEPSHSDHNFPILFTFGLVKLNLCAIFI